MKPWTFSFETAYQRYNSLEMDEDGKMPDQNLVRVELQIFPTYYHTWGFPVLVLKSPL